MHMSQASSDEDDQKQVYSDDYHSPVNCIDALVSTPIRIASFSNASTLDRAHDSEQRRTHIADGKISEVQSEYSGSEGVSSLREIACAGIHSMSVRWMTNYDSRTHSSDRRLDHLGHDLRPV